MFKAILLISSTGIISFAKKRKTCKALRSLPSLHDEPLWICHFKSSLNVDTIISNICLMVMKRHFELVSCCSTERLDPNGLLCVTPHWEQLSRADARKWGTVHILWNLNSTKEYMIRLGKNSKAITTVKIWRQLYIRARQVGDKRKIMMKNSIHDQSNIKPHGTALTCGQGMGLCC